MRVRLQSSLSDMQYSDYRGNLENREEQIAKSLLRGYPTRRNQGVIGVVVSRISYCAADGYAAAWLRGISTLQTLAGFGRAQNAALSSGEPSICRTPALSLRLICLH